jgi:hypothetical protein
MLSSATGSAIAATPATTRLIVPIGPISRSAPRNAFAGELIYIAGLVSGAQRPISRRNGSRASATATTFASSRSWRGLPPPSDGRSISA